MIAVLLATAVGFLAVRFLRVALGGVLEAPVLARRNHRDHWLPTAGGILLVLAVVLVEAGRSGFGALGLGADDTSTARSLVLVAVLGFGFLGLVDDVLGEAGGQVGDRGWRGHLGALGDGRITTGMLKLVGGAGVAVLLVATPGFASGRRLVVDAALIALAANAANLVDRAPGRALKVGLVAWVPLAVVLGGGTVGVAVATVMGGALGLLPDDLRERLMLGDTGANVVGAVLGLGVVLGCAETTRLVVLGALIALNVAGELVSFSRVIAATPPLRALDALGTRRDRA